MKLQDLSPLFQILQNPEHPHFAAALAQITAIAPSQLSAEELPGFAAAVQNAIAALEEEKTTTEAELGKLRSQATALQSYGKNQ